MEKETNKNTDSTFIEFLTITIKYRWFLIWLVFLITASVTAYAVFSAKWYKSTASVFPAEKNDLLSTLSGISSLAKGFSASKGLAALTGNNSESDKYIAILKSASMSDEIIKKFDLRKEYDMENTYYEYVVKEWQDNSSIEIQEEGNLDITVFDKNPQKAANIANYLVQKLNEINTTLGVQNAKANREFVEKRYFQNINDITVLEAGMKTFQEKYGVIAVPQQLEATVKSMSLIYADLYKKEVEYNVLKQTLGIDNPMSTNSKIEMDELQKKINLLNSGNDPSQKDVKLLIPFKEAPALGNEYLKIYRNLEIQYKILEFIQPLYEQAKIEEVRNTPSVLVLDKAIPSDHKAKPKIILYFLLSLVIALSLAFVIILIIEGIRRLRKADNGRLDELVNTVKSDFKMQRRN
jgi:uncharacterized protein involved in exopolysaccharide biosynthesis